MNLIEKINNVSKVFYMNNEVFYIKENKFFNTYKNKEVQLYIISGFSLFKRGSLILKENDTSLFSYDFFTKNFIKVIELKEDVVFFEPMNENDVIVSLVNGNNEKLIRYQNQEKKWEIESKPCYYNLLYKNILFFRDDYTTKSFSKVDIETGSPQWTYTCPEGQKITGEMYEYGGVLAFIEEDEEVNTTLVGLDIKTGKILYKKEVNLIYYKQQEKMLYGFAANSFGDNFYIEINIETGDVTEKSFKNYKNDINSHLATIKEHFLYYSIYKKGGIGIIDLKKREIIQEYPLNLPEGVQIDAPVVTDDKIYVLDSEEVLHIYERPNL